MPSVLVRADTMAVLSGVRQPDSSDKKKNKKGRARSLTGDFYGEEGGTEEHGFSINPASFGYKAWIGFLVFLNILQCFTVPYRVTVEFDDIANKSEGGEFSAAVAFDMCVDVFFYIDILLNFAVGFYDNGALIFDSRRIRARYLRGFFTIDVIASFPADWAIFTISGFWGRFLRMNRLLRLIHVVHYIAEIERTPNINVWLVRLVKLIAYCFLTCHFIACIYYSFAVIEGWGTLDSDWLPPIAVQDRAPISRYLHVLFWALAMMTGNFDDKIPQNANQASFTLFTLVMGVILTAYIVGNVQFAIESAFENLRIFRELIADIQTYLKNYRVPSEIRGRVMEYFMYEWTLHRGLKTQDLLAYVPFALKADIMFAIHKGMLTKASMFSTINFTAGERPPYLLTSRGMIIRRFACGASSTDFHVPKELNELYKEQYGDPNYVYTEDDVFRHNSHTRGFIRALCACLHERVCTPDEYLAREGEVGRSMYVINEGAMQVQVQGKKVQTLQSGDAMGEISCLYGGLRSASVKSSSYCDLYSISGKNLRRVLLEYPYHGQHVMARLAQMAKQIHIKEMQIFAAMGQNVGKVFGIGKYVDWKGASRRSSSASVMEVNFLSPKFAYTELLMLLGIDPRTYRHAVSGSSSSGSRARHLHDRSKSSGGRRRQSTRSPVVSSRRNSRRPSSRQSADHRSSRPASRGGVETGSMSAHARKLHARRRSLGNRTSFNQQFGVFGDAAERGSLAREGGRTGSRVDSPVMGTMVVEDTDEKGAVVVSSTGHEALSSTQRDLSAYHSVLSGAEETPAAVVSQSSRTESHTVTAGSEAPAVQMTAISTTDSTHHSSEGSGKEASVGASPPPPPPDVPVRFMDDTMLARLVLAVTQDDINANGAPTGIDKTSTSMNEVYAQARDCDSDSVVPGWGAEGVAHSRDDTHSPCYAQSQPHSEVELEVWLGHDSDGESYGSPPPAAPPSVPMTQPDSSDESSVASGKSGGGRQGAGGKTGGGSAGDSSSDSETDDDDESGTSEQSSTKNRKKRRPVLSSSEDSDGSLPPTPLSQRPPSSESDSDDSDDSETDSDESGEDDSTGTGSDSPVENEAPSRMSKLAELFAENEGGMRNDDDEPWTTSPFTRSMRVWRVFRLLFCVYNTFIAPFRLSFLLGDTQGFITEWNQKYYFIFCIDLVSDVQLMVDVWLQNRRHVITKAGVISDYATIHRMYMSGWFWFDFLNALPYAYIVMTFAPVAAPYIRLSKILRLYRELSINTELGLQKASSNHIRNSMMRLGLFFVVVTHWSACLYWTFTFTEGYAADDNAWLPHQRYEDLDPYTQYTRACYTSFSLLSGLGKNFTPSSDGQLIYSISITGMGVFAVSYAIGQVSALILNFDRLSTNFAREVFKFNEFMALRDLSNDLQDRLRHFLVHVWSTSQGLRHERILTLLPKGLRNEVAQHMCGDGLQHVSFVEAAQESVRQAALEQPSFASRSTSPMTEQHNTVMTAIAEEVNFESFPQGEFICHFGDIGDSMYIVQEGEVNIMVKDRTDKNAGTGNAIWKTVKVLSEGEVFGESSLLEADHNLRGATVRARTCCHLISVSKSALRRLMRTHEHIDAAIRRMVAKRRTQMKVQDAMATKSQVKKVALEYERDLEMTARRHGLKGSRVAASDEMVGGLPVGSQAGSRRSSRSKRRSRGSKRKSKSRGSKGSRGSRGSRGSKGSFPGGGSPVSFGLDDLDISANSANYRKTAPMKARDLSDSEQRRPNSQRASLVERVAASQHTRVKSAHVRSSHTSSRDTGTGSIHRFVVPIPSPVRTPEDSCSRTPVLSDSREMRAVAQENRDLRAQIAQLQRQLAVRQATVEGLLQPISVSRAASHGAGGGVSDGEGVAMGVLVRPKPRRAMPPGQSPDARMTLRKQQHRSPSARRNRHGSDSHPTHQPQGTTTRLPAQHVFLACRSDSERGGQLQYGHDPDDDSAASSSGAYTHHSGRASLPAQQQQQQQQQQQHGGVGGGGNGSPAGRVGGGAGLMLDAVVLHDMPASTTNTATHTSNHGYSNPHISSNSTANVTRSSTEERKRRRQHRRRHRIRSVKKKKQRVSSAAGASTSTSAGGSPDKRTEEGAGNGRVQDVLAVTGGSGPVNPLTASIHSFYSQIDMSGPAAESDELFSPEDSPAGAVVISSGEEQEARVALDRSLQHQTRWMEASTTPAHTNPNRNRTSARTVGRNPSTPARVGRVGASAGVVGGRADQKSAGGPDSVNGGGKDSPSGPGARVSNAGGKSGKSADAASQQKRQFAPVGSMFWAWSGVAGRMQGLEGDPDMLDEEIDALTEDGSSEGQAGSSEGPGPVSRAAPTESTAAMARTTAGAKPTGTFVPTGLCDRPSQSDATRGTGDDKDGEGKQPGRNASAQLPSRQLNALLSGAGAVASSSGTVSSPLVEQQGPSPVRRFRMHARRSPHRTPTQATQGREHARMPAGSAVTDKPDGSGKYLGGKAGRKRYK